MDGVGGAIGAGGGHRPPRTFKQRRRRLSATQAEVLATVAPTLGVPEEGPVDPVALFGPPPRSGPARRVVLEIGFGLGDGTVALARQRPAEAVIALDVHRPGVAHLLAEAAGAGLANIRVACADAVEFTPRLPDAGVDEIRAFCPDPWPKARHAKRRLVRPDILDEWARVLRPGGRVWVATDWGGYAEWACEQLAGHPSFALDSPEAHRHAAADRPDTLYAARGRAAGRSMHDIVGRRH